MWRQNYGINVMAEIDVPGHGESWGTGYPDLWPSASCKEPLDVSKNFTFEVLSGILEDMREIFPFELFHLGGDEVNTDCWKSTAHVKQWLQETNMTTKDAYQYFVLKAQEIAISKNWTPVNWEETFNTFGEKLNPKTVVHNWLGAGVCPKVVAKGLKCIYSNQGFWYLDHLDVPWDQVYDAEPLEGITDASEQKLVLGGEVCMWSETADPSNVQQTIWPRAAAAAERLWTSKEAAPISNTSETALTRLQYFRCLLTRRGVQASPVTNFYARNPPTGPGSCYDHALTNNLQLVVRLCSLSPFEEHAIVQTVVVFLLETKLARLSARTSVFLIMGCIEEFRLFSGFGLYQPEEVCIKVFASRRDPGIPFVFWVWKSVDFQERESYDIHVWLMSHDHVTRA
ncbi:beta-hexosaminidase 1 [Tanacetum coccineum]